MKDVEKKIHAVDLDSTLARYTEFISPSHIGAPVPAMVRRVKQWLKNGEEVVIFTARVSSQHSESEREEAQKAIEQWTLKYIGQKLPVTAEKTPDIVDYYDDRAKQVEKNTGRVIGEGKTMDKPMDTPPMNEPMGGGTTCPKCGAKLELKAVEPVTPRMPTSPRTGGRGEAMGGGAMDESSVMPDKL
jgi:hypothetical protein